MKIALPADLGFGANIERLTNEHIDKIPTFFETKKYGNDSIEIFIVVVCSVENYTVRKRIDTKEQVLYFDVVPNFNKVSKAKMELKKKILAEDFISSFDIIDKYKKLGISKIDLKTDLDFFFKSIGWLVNQ